MPETPDLNLSAERLALLARTEDAGDDEPPAVAVHDARKALHTPLVAERFANDDAEAIGSTPQEYDSFIRREQKIWSDIVKRANIKTD